MRKLASFRNITEIKPISDADSIECAVIDGGWEVLVKKGDFSPGDHCIYLEIDSWVPHEIAPFLSKDKEPREYNGVKGERLKTVRLRKQISQGLILPIHEFPQVNSCNEDDDLTEILGIQKWEPDIPANLRGTVKGNFPDFIPKTDQERIQNLNRNLEIWRSQNEPWEVTEKLDGSSMTVYWYNDTLGVCSRNLDLMYDEDNAFWREAINNNFAEKMKEMCEKWGGPLALQGELIGEGIQKNPYKLKGNQFHLFDIYDINNRVYIPSRIRRNLSATYSIVHAPIVEFDFKITSGITIRQLLKEAEGKSALNKNTEREGLVFKNLNHPSMSFKAISNKFLLKNDG